MTAVSGPLLGWLAGIAAWSTWSGMVTDPRDFLVPTALGGLAMVATGVVLTRLGVQAHLTVLLQLAVAVLALNSAVAPEESLAGVVPTPASLEQVATLVTLGGEAMAYYVTPIEAFQGGTRATLVAAGLALLWVVAALVQGLARPALAALPLLVAVSVPITILDEAVSPLSFVVTGVAFLMLLVTDRQQRWQDARWPGREEGWGSGGSSHRPLPPAATAWQVAATSVLVALVVTPLVPVVDAAPPGAGAGSDGSGGSGTVRLTTVNPFVTLQRDLLEQTDTPMVYARTDATDPGYLRTTVLDVFTDRGWSASQRELPRENSADGRLPAPPGLRAGAGGETARWELQLDTTFATRWLPLPSPVREVSVPGSWRYDDRFLDVALTSGAAAPGLRYEALSLTPPVSARSLDRALSPPDSVRGAFTEVPDELPDEIRDVATRVTREAGAESSYARAVALQDWFREDGGFRYSLDGRPGSGMQLLADFVTVDKVGYCEQYAAAMAAMGRALDIPSRVAVGFLRPERLPDGRLLYTSDTRHAWVEMFFAGAGWVRFEPTPAQVSGASPAYTRQSVTEDGVSPTPQPEAADRRLAEQLDPENTDLGSEREPRWAAWVTLAILVLLVLAGLAPRAVRRAQRRRRLAPAPDGLVERVWSELRADAVDASAPWDDRHSPREQARALRAEVLCAEEPGADAATDSMEMLLREVERGRYAPVTAQRGGLATRNGVADPQDLLAVERQWRVLLAAHGERRPVTGIERWRRRLLPASLVQRQRSRQ